MDQILEQVIAILRGMWQRRWIGVAVAWVVAVGGAVAVIRMPERYEATARVYVDTQSVLKPLMAGLAVQPDVNQQISMLARTLITRPNIETLIRNADLTILTRNERERDALVERLTNDIKLTGGGRENLYNVMFRDTEKQRAQRVVQTLVSMFVESGLGGKRRDSESARKFIDEQIKVYEAKLEEAETRVKEFKLRNMAYTSGTNAGQDFFGRVAALTEEAGAARVELRVAEESRDALRRELAGEDPVLLADPQSTISSAQIPELDSRMDAARKQLDELMRRFTDQHPDVLALRRQIALLEQQKREELDARRKLAPQSKGLSAATNPVFQRIKIALADAEANVAALRVRVGAAQARLEQLRSSANRVPQVEAELAQLNRDYEILRKNYESLVGRRESAAISEDVDATAQLAEFRVIDPPRVSPHPVFPNRASLAPLVLLGALAAGVLVCFGVAQVFPRVESVKSLRQLAQRPVLGSVSLRLSDRLLRKRRVTNLAFGASLASMAAIFGTWIMWMAWGASRA